MGSAYAADQESRPERLAGVPERSRGRCRYASMAGSPELQRGRKQSAGMYSHFFEKSDHICNRAYADDIACKPLACDHIVLWQSCKLDMLSAVVLSSVAA